MRAPDAACWARVPTSQPTRKPFPIGRHASSALLNSFNNAHGPVYGPTLNGSVPPEPAESFRLCPARGQSIGIDATLPPVLERSGSPSTVSVTDENGSA